MAQIKGDGTVADYRRARHKYDIQETFEAGLSLMGPEVKSLRGGQASLEGSFARLEDEEVWLYHMHVPAYAFNTLEPLDPTRKRKLLLKRKEIKRLIGKMTGKRLVLVPLKVYFKRGWAKVLLGLGTGKAGKDRRDEIKKRDADRDISRELRRRNR